jgi:hypothetical protein
VTTVAISVGDDAPAFELLSARPPTETYRFGHAPSDRVSLLVFPRRRDRVEDDFGPVLDFAWFQFEEYLEIVVITDCVDHPVADAFNELTTDVRLLADVDGRVADAYGVGHAGCETTPGERATADAQSHDARHDRAVAFLVDGASSVRASWSLSAGRLDLTAIRDRVSEVRHQTETGA